MKISLSEIWNFSDLIKADERGWSYRLIAGRVTVDNITQDVLQELRTDPHYDTELLPSIFTFREILWQPDVFIESVSSLPGLRILKAHCEEMIEEYATAPSSTHVVYNELLQGLSASCGVAVAALEEGKSSVNKVLGEFRTAAFPIIKFFIFHPQNRLDYYRDAVNRLNYAVKIMLTQFHGKYTELNDPFWEVIYEQTRTVEKSPKNPPKEKEKS
ncbi:MAG: hypothetical protein RIC53_08425 [Cyclobacteriaceae bacterium]